MKLSDSEWTVMNAVWQRAPASARDVLEALGREPGWAYTTVKTMLTRLVEKGALRMERRANRNLYEPLVTRANARRAAVRSLLERAFDGAFGTMLQHIVREEDLSSAERAELARLIDEVDQDRSGGGDGARRQNRGRRA
jgi:BlaI family penicillinase repressor